MNDSIQTAGDQPVTQQPPADAVDLLITPIDREAEENGTWTKIHGVWFLIRRGSNEDYRNKFLKIQEESTAAQENGASNDEIEAAYTPRWNRLLANYILLDWRGKNADGVPLPRYTKELGYRLLMNDRDIAIKIRNFAHKEQNFYRDAVKKSLEE